MKVTFVRTAGEKDRIYVHRGDGSEVSWSFPSYGDALPHDLVHLVVEKRFGLTSGVWGRVAAGADLGRINAAANKRGGMAGYAALGDPQELLLAEAIANASWLRPDEAPDADSLLAQMLEMATIPDRVTSEAITEVRAELVALRDRWRALVPKGALELDW